jgi:TatD DNase family protein
VAASTAAVALAEQESNVWATAGIHPHEASGAGARELEQLRALASSPRVVAIGEIGLDFHYDHSPHADQAKVLQLQLELADELGLPVVIHSRDADADTFAILSAWSRRRRGSAATEPFGVMHCYAYGPDRLGAYADLGLFISIPGIVTYPKATEAQRSAILADGGIFVLETDCPYLAPQSHRGRRNEPAFMRETAEQVATLRGEPLELVSARSSANARRLYRLPS